MKAKKKCIVIEKSSIFIIISIIVSPLQQ